MSPQSSHRAVRISSPQPKGTSLFFSLTVLFPLPPPSFHKCLWVPFYHSHLLPPYLFTLPTPDPSGHVLFSCPENVTNFTTCLKLLPQSLLSSYIPENFFCAIFTSSPLSFSQSIEFGFSHTPRAPEVHVLQSLISCQMQQILADSSAGLGITDHWSPPLWMVLLSLLDWPFLSGCGSSMVLCHPTFPPKHVGGWASSFSQAFHGSVLRSGQWAQSDIYHFWAGTFKCCLVILQNFFFLPNWQLFCSPGSPSLQQAGLLC